MHLTLSQEGHADVREALGVLSAPLDASSPDDWRYGVLDRVGRLLGADGGAVVVRRDGRARVLADRYEAHVAEQYRGYYHALDLGLHALQRRPDLSVWTRSMLWPRGSLLESEYYNDFALPNRIYDSVGMKVALGAPDDSVTFSFHQRGSRAGAFGDPERVIMELLLPALAAGERTLERLGEETARLGAVLDAVATGIVVLDRDGGRRHVNVALHALLSSDPESARVQREIDLLGRQGLGLLGDGVTGATSRSLRSRVRTEARSYVLHVTCINSDRLVPSGSVLVMVEAVEPGAPDLLEALSHYPLTPRETEVARLLAEGLSNRRLSERLGIMESTVRHHVEQVLLKLNINRRSRLLPTLLERAGRGP